MIGTNSWNASALSVSRGGDQPQPSRVRHKFAVAEQLLDLSVSVTKYLQVRRSLAYLDECERELTRAEALIAANPARKRGAMAADISDLDLHEAGSGAAA